MPENFPQDIEPRLGLAYDDVLIVPQYSAIASRKNVTTKTKLARDIELQIPIISSNMDTVTMTRMAVAMAQLGGIGFIHRFLTIEDEVRVIENVKRNRAHVIPNPYTITPDKTIRDVRADMEEYSVGGLIVVQSDQDPRVIGIITERDIYSEGDDELVKDVMTPRERMVVGTPDISVSEARKKMHRERIEKLPLLDENDHCPGLIVMKDIIRLEHFPGSSIDDKGRYLVGASVGVVDDYLERADELVKAGADVLVVDVAHAHAVHVLRGIEKLHQNFTDTPLIAGTIATAAGTEDLIKAGADAIRCGIGAGSACTTRLVAGAGVPMFTSVMEASRQAKKHGIPIIADGGIKGAADLSKAIGAGAHTAMLGSMLAGAEEAPGRIVERDGRKLKVYRGMASMGAFVSKKMAEGEADEAGAEYTPEGVESVIPITGPVVKIVKNLVGGLRSGMSYTGVDNIDDFHERVRFVRTTQAAQIESSPHVLQRGERE
jgi:IMP dehydrogenase